MEKSFKRFLSLAMAILMVLSNVPVQAFATDGTVTECAEHNFDISVNTDATCTTAGVSYQECGVCGYQKDYTQTPSLGHSYADGVCAVCGATDPDSNGGTNEPSGEGSVCEHIWGEAVNVTSTCETAGTGTQTCTVDGCGETQTVDVAALGHKWGEAVNETATCEAAGTGKQTCTVDGCGKTQTVDVAALGHKWGEAVNETATCEAAGNGTQTCTVDGCGKTQTVEVAALGHNYVEGVCEKCGGAEPSLLEEEVKVGTDTDFTDAQSDETGEGWTWTNSTKTLTLNGATITGAVVLPAGSAIVVTEDTENSVVVESGNAIYSEGDLAVSGTGKLTVKSGVEVADARAIRSLTAITVNGTQLNAEAECAVAAPSVTITNAKVNLYGYYYGIHAKTTSGTAESVVMLNNVSGKIAGYRYGGINAHSETANVTVKLNGCKELEIYNEVTTDSTSVNFNFAGIRAYTRGSGKDVLVELNNCQNVSISNSTMAILAANNANAANEEAANVKVLIKDSKGIELTGNTSCYSAVFVNNYGVENGDNANLVIESSTVEVNAPKGSGLMTSTKSAPSEVDIMNSDLTITAGLTGIRTIASGADYADTDVTGSNITFKGDLTGSPVDESVGTVVEDEDYYDETSTVVNENDLIRIGTADELQAFAAAVNGGNKFEGKTVLLTADINLSGINWTPIGNDSNYFWGTFDGQDHTISNMTIDVNTPDANQFVGLFGGVRKATIKNFKMTNVKIDVVGAKVRAAAVVAIAHSNSENHTTANINLENITVDGCTINAEAKSSSVAAGGLSGYCYPANMKNISISNLTLNPKASSTVFAGGLVGYQQGQNISNNGNTRAYFTIDTFNLNNITINTDTPDVLVGGYAGYTYYGYITLKNGTINGFKANITGATTEALIGGLIGFAHRSDRGHTFANVDITGLDIDVSSTSGRDVLAGGMVGYSGSPIAYADCSVTGTITDTCSGTTSSAIAGGFVGQTASWTQSFNNCTADVDIEATNIAGGFVGVNSTTATYTDCEAKGTVEAKTAGGFAGSTNNATYTNCTYTGESDIPFIPGYAAQVGTTYYKTLAEAVAAANAVEGGATVTLLGDVTLGEMLTITGNVTISGKKTITRADSYTGTLFAVNAGATLTLDGGLVIDGANEWVFDKVGYDAALKANDTNYSGFAFATSEENAPVAKARMFIVNGSLVMYSVTIQNHMGNNANGVVGLTATGKLALNDGATLKHNATAHSSVIANVATGAEVTINEGTLITDNYYAKNGGIFLNNGTIVMNGGEISHNVGVNTNGTVAMMYTNNAKFIMNDGLICSNSTVRGSGAGRCAAIYLHATGIMEMNGGSICHNIGAGYGGVDTNQYSGTSLTITGGSIVNNESINGNANADVNWMPGNMGASISGGTFTQDVSAWLAPDAGLIYDAEKGTYGLTEDLYQYNGTAYKSLAEIIAAIKNSAVTYAAEAPVVKVLASHKIDDTIVVDTNLVLDLNGKTITTAATAAGEYEDAFTILADVTVTGDGVIDARPSHGYTFYIGDKNGNAGNLTIENGTFYGETSVVNNRLGTVTINGGNFAVSLENADDDYRYTLNCIDANYNADTAKIEVKGGTFYKFNPADNAAEGTGTSFVADGYLAEADGDYYGVRVDKDALDPIVTITFTDSNGNSEVTLKYPSERFDSIQKLIGTNDYGDFVLGATQSELLTYIADGRASNIVMTLNENIELDAPISFYNKYFQIPVEYALTINGNGKTITWADGYTGTLFNVESGVSVEMKNLTIDGENEFTFYNDTTTVEDGQNWYTRFVNVGEEDKAVNANVIVNAGNLTLGAGTKIQNVTIASDSGNGKTANTADGGYNLMYNDDLAIIKSNGGKVNIAGDIIGNAGLVLNAINAESTISGNITGNMGAGNKGGIIIANGGKMALNDASICGNKAMARSATVLGVINGSVVTMNGETKIDNNKHIGVGSNTAGSIVCLEGASQFVMNGGSISNNVGGRAGAIASRWVGSSYGQHEDTSIVLNAGTITGNTASNDSWNGASVFLRSPATIGEGLTIDGTIAVNAAPGELDITGGTFTNFNLVVTDGLSAEITGGSFDADPTEWLAEGYVAPKNTDGTYTARKQSYVEWVKAELLAGNDVTLTEDIVITDYDLVNALVLPSNGNGKYDERHGNGAVFHVIQPGVELDLNGHSITWDAHDDAYCNKRQVSLFMVTITGNANETAGLTVKDSAGTGKVDVYGMGSGMYVVGVDATGTIAGGTWTNHPCETCGASNIFLYPSHGGTMEITGGTFEQKNSEYLLGWMGSTEETTNNGVGVDYDQTKVEISGGTFVNFNPEDVKFFDTANGSAESEKNGCAEGYVAKDNGDGTYGVKEWYDANANTLYIYNESELRAFAAVVNGGNTLDGKTIEVMADIDLGGETWTPIASFAGNFVGNNKTIKNFHIDATSARGGFFNVIAASNGLEDVKVKDLILSDVTATVGNTRFGTLANSVQGVVHNVTVKNVTVTTTHTNAWVGGMCAFMSWPWMTNCTVENLTVNATAGADMIGGFACILQKNSNHVFDNLDVKGFKVTVADTDSSGCGVGGFVAQTQRGWEYPKVINSDITGIDITATGLVDVGGFIAWPGAHTIAENCNTEGKIDVTGVTSADCFAGGFFGNLGWNADLGQMGHKVTNCSADVDIITKVANAGGFVGSATNSNNASMYATFTNCSASGDVTSAAGGTADIGGFAGDADRGEYNNCSATGTVTNNGNGFSGGFIGNVLDTTPKYDGRYPAGTRKYLVDVFTFDTCSGSAEPFIGNVAVTKPASELINKVSYVAQVGDIYYATFNNALAAAKASHSKAITLLAPVVLTENTTLDLTGITIDGNGVYPAFRIQNGANVTVKGGQVTNTDYVFVLGSSDKTSAGNLTIESGKFHGATTVASVTKGTLSIKGGEFSVDPYENSYEFLLNCIDANYKDGSAKIVVTGGTFANFNPAANAAEGNGTNFVPFGYAVKESGTNYIVEKATNLEIWNADDLWAFAALANAGNTFSGKTVKLMADIDLGGETWTPIKSFAGTFDGGNHTIKNFTLDGTNGQAGFFKSLGQYPAAVKNLTLSDVVGTAGSERFAILAATGHTATVTNVNIKNAKVTTTNKDAKVGAIYGYFNWTSASNCTIENFEVDATTGAMFIGGFAGWMDQDLTMDNVDINGFKVTVSDTDNDCAVGGFTAQTQTGHRQPTFANCDIKGLDVTATGTVDVGGFIADPGAHTITNNCTVEGKIDAIGITNGSAGGFLADYGWNNNESNKGGHKLTNCSANVAITTKTAPAGGFVGSATNDNNRNMPAALTNCSATGTITVVEGGTANIGGFAGEADRGTYTNCTATQEPFIGSVAENATLVNMNSYVARVGDVYYATMTAALKSCTNGETVYLLNDITELVAIENPAVIDLNGYTITEIQLASTGATLKAVANLNVTTNVDGMKVVYEEGVYKLVNKAIKVTVTVNNATMVEGNALPEFSYTTDVENVPALDITYTVDGTTINATVAEMEGYEFTVVPGTLTVEEALVRVYAKNNANAKFFTSLKEAIEFAVAQKGNIPVYLLSNITVGETIVVNDTNAGLVELQGDKTGGQTFTITSTHAGELFKVEKGTLAVKNLKINSQGDTFYVTGGTLNLNYHSVGKQFIEVTSQTGNCIYTRGGSVNVNGAKLTALGEYPAIQGNGDYIGNVTITKWNIGDGTYPVISAPNSDMAIYWPQNGKLTVEGGKITGDTALYAKSGTIVINGGEFIATGAKADFAHNSNGASATGDAVVIESCKDAAYETPVVTITGGTFTSENAKAFAVYNCNENATLTKFISGGVFNTDIDDALSIEDHRDSENEDGTWTIKKIITITLNDMTMVAGNALPEFTYTVEDSVDVTELITFSVDGDTKVPGTYTLTATAKDTAEYTFDIVAAKLTVLGAVCKIGEVNYASLADAVKAVAKGDPETTITLLCDQQIKHQMVGHTYAQNIVIDLGGYTLSSTDKTLTAYRSGSTLTLKNGTVSGNTTGGTLVATYGGKLVLGENLKVTSGGQATAIRVDNGTLEINSDIDVIGGKYWLVTAGNRNNQIVISAGDFTGNMSIAEGTNMQLSGGWYDVQIQEAWCAEGYGPKYYAKDNRWTVGNGVMTVDGKWFDSWDEAESSITKNSAIVLYDDVANTYGGTVIKDFKFPASGGTITLDLNGHTLTSAKTNGNVTTMTVQGNTTLEIKGGGKIVFDNANSYSFVMAKNAKIKLMDGVKFSGSFQWNSGGDLYIGESETPAIGQNGNFRINGTTRVVMNEAGDWTLSVGSLTMAADDATLANNTLTINKDRSIDLAGHNLIANNITVFGNLIDSADGVGSVVTENLWFNGHNNGGYLPLLDGDCYRLFATILDNRGVKPGTNNTFKAGFTVRFNKANAYDLLIAAVKDGTIKATASFVESGATMDKIFTASGIEAHLKNAKQQLINTGTVKNAITGDLYLASNTVIVVAALNSGADTNVIIESQQITYSKS